MWGGGTSRNIERRWSDEVRRARAAWVLASDLASDLDGADLRQVVQHHTGRRGRTVDDVTARARKIACYLAVVTASAGPELVAQASGLHRGTIHKHCAWVEDERDKPEFDALIERLEQALVGMCARVVLARLGELDAGGGA